MIRIAENLSLPDDAVTQKFAFLARSGAGKTYAAGKMVEEFAVDGHQVVVVDPVGVWWGLRLAADGKKPGISNFYVFGGQRGDVPLEATAGNLIADVVVDHGLSAVVDVSDFTGAEQRRFVADFATRLLQRKKSARTPLMVVWEECQDFVPQRVMAESARMVGAMERLIKQGRNFGVGTTLISQRPQAVNKDVLNQTECLVVLQTTGPQERKTILGWVVENSAAVAAAVDDLPSLGRGEAFIWSPQWLRTFKKIKVGKKWTFDASSTPTADHGSVARELAPVNLDAIRTAMAETVERVKQDDPRQLRAEITRLKTELAKKPPAVAERVEVPVLKEWEIKQLEDIGAAFQKSLNDFNERLAAVVRGSNNEKILSPIRHAAGQMKINSAPLRVTAPKEAARHVTGMSRPQGRMLDALATFSAIGLQWMYRSTLAAFTGQSPRSSGFDKNLSTLRSGGCIEYPEPSKVRLTEKGATMAQCDSTPTSLLRLHAAWSEVVSGPQSRMLAVLIPVFPQSVTRDHLAEVTAQSPSSSGFDKNLSTLRGLGVISYPSHGEVAATELLFPPSLS